MHFAIRRLARRLLRLAGWSLGSAAALLTAEQPAYLLGDRFRGPEGIVADRSGALYASDQGDTGIIRQYVKGEWRVFFEFGSRLGATRRERPLLGLGIDRAGNLYACAPKYRGGAVIRIPMGHSDQASVFATQLGFPNGLIADGRFLYVTDTQVFSHGHIYKLPLDRYSSRAPLPSETFPSPFPLANGIALSPNGQTLYVVHSRLWQVSHLSAIAVSTMDPSAEASLPGLCDGIGLFQGRLWVCQQRPGGIFLLDPHELEHHSTLLLAPGIDGPIHPASIASYHGCRGRSLAAVTDVADANPLMYLLRDTFGWPLPWHRGVYAFPLSKRL